MAKRHLNGFRALLIDLDGTLVDSVPDLAAAVNRLLGEEGRSALSREQVRGMVGDGVAKLVERAFTTTGGLDLAGALPALVERFVGLYQTALSVETRPFPGVPETLTRLKDAGLQLAVCTNKPQAASVQVLRDLGLAASIDLIAGGDAFPVRKPDPGHLLGVLGDLGVAPSAAAMLGDSQVDVAAARNAGLPVVLVSYGYAKRPARELGADAVIDRFEEILKVLQNLSRPSH